MSIFTAIPYIADVVDAVSGVEIVPDYPTDQQVKRLFGMVYVARGTVTVTIPGEAQGLDNVFIDILKVRDILAKDLQVLAPLWESVPNALLAEITYSGASVAGGHFTNSIDTFESVEREFIPNYLYANVLYIGYRFTMVNIKVRTTL